MTTVLLVLTIHEKSISEMDFHLAQLGFVTFKAIKVKIAFYLLNCFWIDDEVHLSLP